MRRRYPTPSLLPTRTLLSARQHASVFNQPLSFDTSRVTNMWGMFYVRSSRAPASNHRSCGYPARCLRRRRPTRPPFSQPAYVTPLPTHTCFPFGSAWQYTRVFDHPLSFDTSNVTSMAHMFEVGSARAPASKILQLGPPCTRLAPPPPSRRPPRPLPSSSPACYSLRKP